MPIFYFQSGLSSLCWPCRFLSSIRCTQGSTQPSFLGDLNLSLRYTTYSGSVLHPCFEIWSSDSYEVRICGVPLIVDWLSVLSVWFGWDGNRTVRSWQGTNPNPTERTLRVSLLWSPFHRKFSYKLVSKKVIGYIPHFLRNFVIEGATVKKNITKSAFIFWLMPPKVPLRSLRHQLAVSNTYALCSVD